MTINIEAIRQILGAYFHQDWPEEFGTEMAVLDTIRKTESKELLTIASDNISALLSSGLNDSELKEIIINDVGCYFDPTSKGKNYREWLDDISRYFELS